MQVFGLILFVAVVSFVASFPFSIPNKITVSLILGFLSYGLFEYCFGRDAILSLGFNLGKKGKFYHSALLLLYLLMLALVILPVDSSVSSFYSSWTAFSLLDLAKLFASVLLTSFLTGYVIVDSIYTEFSENVFSREAKVVLSVLISLGLTSFTAYVTWIFTGGFSTLRYALLSLHVLIFLALLLTIFLKRKQSDEQPRTSYVINSAIFYKSIVLVSIVAFLLWMFLSTHSSPQTFNITGDEFDHVGLAVQISKGWQSWQSTQTQSGTYPFFLQLVFLSAAALSNVPILNTFLSFAFLLVIPFLAFYLMAKTLFDDDEKPLLATVLFSVFAGSGWLYASFLRGGIEGASDLSAIAQASQTTYDVIRSSWLPIYIAPYVVEISIFFVLVGLIFSKRIDTKTLSFLTVFLVSFSALVHVEKILILTFLLFFLSILHSLNLKKFLNHPKTVLASFVCGLALTLVLDTFAPYNVSQDYFSLIRYALFACLGGLIIIFTSERYKEKLSRLKLHINKEHIKPLIAYIAFALYLFLTVSFFYSYSTYTFNEPSVPLWFLPLKTGIVGLLALAGLFYSIREKSSVDLTIVLVIGVLLLEILLYHIPLSLTYVVFSEFRIIRDVLWAFLSLVAAYGLKRLLSILRKTSFIKKLATRYGVACLFLFIIIAGSIPSHLLKVEYFSASQQAVSTEELTALEYLSHLKIPSGSYILTGFSKNVVYAVTGVPPIGLSDPVYTPLIFNSKSASAVLWTLNYLNVSYIYLTTQDLHYLNSHYGHSYFNWLISQLPLIFSNNATKIYSVPPLAPTFNDADTAVVTGDLLAHIDMTNSDYLWIDDALTTNWTQSATSKVEYSNFESDGNLGVLSAKTIVNQQAAVFYTKDLDKYLQTDQGTVAVVNFKSNTANSYAVVDVLYYDGSTQRFTLESRTYMNSLKWVTASIFLQPNKVVKSIRIGITDDSKANGESIGCSFDYVGLAQTDYPVSYYASPLFASLMQIKYTTISESDPSLFEYNTLFVPDQNFSDTELSQYIDWVSNGGSLVIENTKGSGDFSKLIGISYTNNLKVADSIIDDASSRIELTGMNISNIQLDDTPKSVMANFALRNSIVSPYAILKTIGQGKLVYIDLASIFNGLKGTQDLAKSAEWTSNLLKKHINLAFFNSNAHRRVFYVKNIGDIISQGRTEITVASIVSGFEKLGELKVSFSNNTFTNSELFPKLLLNTIKYFGDPTITLYIDGNVTVSPVDSNSYLKISLNGTASFEFVLGPSESLILFPKNSSINNLLFSNGILRMNSTQIQSVDLIVRNPAVTSFGLTTLTSMFAGYPYDFTSKGNQGIVDGTLEYKIERSEETVMLLDDVQLDGTLNIVPTTSSASADFNFLLNYPLDSVFFISIIVLVTFFIYAKIQKKPLKKEAPLDQDTNE